MLWDLSPGCGGEGHSRVVFTDGWDSRPRGGTPVGRRQATSPPCPLSLVHLRAATEGQGEMVRHKVVRVGGDSGGGEKEMEEDAKQDTRTVSGKSTGAK